MPNEKSAALPEHLVPLLEPTPSGAAKLVAVWDGLNTESQILILTRHETTGMPSYLNEKVRVKALDSANAYVRYLAAKRLYFGTGDTEEKKGVKRRIEKDPDRQNAERLWSGVIHETQAAYLMDCFADVLFER